MSEVYITPGDWYVVPRYANKSRVWSRDEQGYKAVVVDQVPRLADAQAIAALPEAIAFIADFLAATEANQPWNDQIKQALRDQAMAFIAKARGE